MKKIILLSDGTGNSAGKRNKTNVWRLYNALDLHRDDQIAMYSDGVGTGQFLLFKILGGVFGWGLKSNVIELYEFLCRNYSGDGNESNSDKIYLFGFSRGAFTVRILAGMIAHCGLYTDKVSEVDLHKKARHNYRVYRSKFYRCQLATLFVRKHSSEDAHATVRPKIEFIGVWDTVDAYGLPIDELKQIWDKFICPLRFPDQELSSIVSKACHCISIDEERRTFSPVLWNESNESDTNRIEQVWFSGVHSDVGGGYPRFGLALVSLDWMMSKVEQKSEVEQNLNDTPRLCFIESLRDEYKHRCDWDGVQHDSRAGLAAYYRYKPRDIERICNNPKAGVKIAVPKIHRSVFERIKRNVVPYAPAYLPLNYEIISTCGETPPPEKETPPSEKETPPPEKETPPPEKFESNEQAKCRVSAMNGARDIIYWRRWLYVAFFVTTLLLFVLPVTIHDPFDCAFFVFLTSWLDPFFNYSRKVLPNFVVSWTDALQQEPVWLVTFAVLFAILGWLKRCAFSNTLVRATAAWSALKTPQQSSLYSSTTTMKLRKFPSSKICPKFQSVYLYFIFAVIIFIAIFSRVILHASDTAGWLCEPSSNTNPNPKPIASEEKIDFETSNPCLWTKVALTAGNTYLIKTEVQTQWTDGELETGPNGLQYPTPIKMNLFAPFRRHASRPWFELTGRIGPSGRDAFAIGSATCYTARSSGELLLYINDAVFSFLFGIKWRWPYHWSIGPNSGTATVTVTPIEVCSACNC